MLINPTDIELIREVLQNDNARAFETLMKRYTSSVYGAALRLMKDEDEAQEVTQMAFIQAYRQLDSWRGENFGAWLTIIANHIALRMLEKEKPPSPNSPKPTDNSSNGTITKTSRCKPSPNNSGKQRITSRYACTAYANE